MIKPTVPGLPAISPEKTRDPKAPKTVFEQQARKTAESFEALMMGEMLKSMFSGIKQEGMFGGGQSETVYRSMVLDEYGKSLSGKNGFGIADQIYKDIMKNYGIKDE